MARKGSRDRGIFFRSRRHGEAVGPGGRRGEWWIRWCCPLGHEHRSPVGPKGLALEEYRRAKVRARTEGYCPTQERERQQRERPTLFTDAADQYEKWAEAHRPRSLKFRVSALKHLREAFTGKTLAVITRADVEAYQARRRDAKAAPGTVNRERAVLSHLFSKAQAWGLVQTNPVEGTEREREPDGKPRPLTPDEEARLFMVLPAHYRPAVTLALHTGLRLGELRHQAWRDVDLPGATLAVTRPKSGKAETIPLNTTARAVLGTLERTGPLVFPTLPVKLSDLFIRYARKAGLAGVTFHCLRDTYISRLACHVSTPSLMALARHRDYRTTRRYVQVDADHLRAAVERLNPVPTGTKTGTTENALAEVVESVR